MSDKPANSILAAAFEAQSARKEPADAQAAKAAAQHQVRQAALNQFLAKLKPVIAASRKAFGTRSAERLMLRQCETNDRIYLTIAKAKALPAKTIASAAQDYRAEYEIAIEHGDLQRGDWIKIGWTPYNSPVVHNGHGNRCTTEHARSLVFQDIGGYSGSLKTLDAAAELQTFGEFLGRVYSPAQLAKLNAAMQPKPASGPIP